MGQSIQELTSLLRVKLTIDKIADDINKHPSLTEITKLSSLIKKLDKPSIFLLKNGFINPILSILCRPDESNEQILLETIRCLKLLTDHGGFLFVDNFFDLYAILFQLIDTETDSLKGNCLIGEDLKLNVILLMQCLLSDDKNEAVIEKCIDSIQFRPILGHSIHVLLSIGLNEKYKRLQIESTATLNTLLCKYYRLSSSKDTSLVQDIFASFLPGISIKIMEMVTKDDKISKQMAVNCLKVLSSISKLSLSNYGTSLENLDSNESFRVYRNAKWLENSFTKLKIVIEKVIRTLIINKSEIVRKMLVTFSHNFLFEILFNISSKVEAKNSLILTILEVPLSLLYDDDEEIRTNCDTLLEKMSDKLANDEKYIADLVLDEFYQFLTRLTREIQWNGEDQNLAKFKLLTGYLRCLSNCRLSTFLTSEVHQQRLFHCLISCLQFSEKSCSSTDQLVVNLNLNKNNSKFELENYPKKRFKWFDSFKCEQQLRQACLLIGRYSNPHSLIDYFTNVFQNSINNSLLYIINSSILGVQDIKTLEPLLEQYISLFTTKCSEEVAIFQQALSICLLTEGFDSFAKIFRKSKQHYILINALYLILANIASSNQGISSTSMVALNKLSIYFDYQSIKEIIIDNVDYLINYLNASLKHFENDRKYLAVISAIFTLTNLSTLQCLSLTIENILSNLDIYYYIRCDNLVDALNIIVAYIHHQTFKKSRALTQSHANLFEDSETRKAKFKENIISLFKSKQICDTLQVEEDHSKDFQEWKAKLEKGQISSDDLDYNDNDAGEEVQEDQDKKIALPYHIEVTKQILERCYNLTSFPDVKIRLIILDIIIKGIEILKPLQDDLFPLCHKMWPALIARLKESNILVITKSFVCLLSLAKCCGDFLKSRTISEIIPHLTTFVKTQAKESYKKTDQSAYRFTIEYKLQIQVLKETGLLCYYLNLEGKCIWSLIEAFLIYLSKHQPKSLQESSMVSLECWYNMDPTTVRYLIYRFKSNQKTQEFEANIRNLLQKRT